MPEKETLRRTRQDKREGKPTSTQAGEFVREEIHHIREGKHGARSAKQAIAIGLSKARRAGIDLPAPAKGKTSEKTRKQAARDTAASRRSRKTSPKRSRATTQALQPEAHAAASHQALARQAKRAARQRTPAERRASARKGQSQRTPADRSASARKAASTRARRSR